MSIYQPYTYLIGWSEHNKWYYGVRFGKGCNPSDLWTSYFTSSVYVSECRTLYGEPDVVQVRKTFTNKESALNWEQKVLTKMNAVSDERWLNRQNNGNTFFVDENVAKKRGAKHKGFRHSDETKAMLSEIAKKPRKKGRVFTEEWRRKLSESRKKNVGEKSPTYGKRWKWSREIPSS